ncbi:LysR family transcriptional regulator [Limosilactobacillus reuteri]|uniref:LysR family transcriptional regulator n=1 Tax=Limosilactobacillus reuteri TaxID=1598 RepID=UPI001E36C9C6|nr:LysR family transcriptional regulator [Limosilactobacillus reuteri]MCC4326058.1 LysR family transcriptional regulator [Limosilactobacillus reuteri]MCC4329808.1 LysR family transcriptional regulator [Limosilactobacillus reuteri]MCC4351471.1 LysR family transcriptional regulator [Limosilactobacillus reuteri]MCC4378069.1 LysR family transcriptional regulator [Limosilactobacillus reuteri]
MDTRVLKYFLTVAQTNNITKAAEQLHITQPTLSRQIMDLETELDIKLFNRGNRRLQLTKAGILFQQRATTMLQLLDQTENDLHQQEEALTGEINLGSAVSSVSPYITKLIFEFQKLYPNVIFNLSDGDGDVLRRQLDEGLNDLVCLLEPVEAAKYNFLELPIREEWGVIMKKSAPLAKYSTITKEDLYKIPLILPHRSIVRDEVSDILKLDQTRLNIRATTSLPGNTVSLLRNSNYYGLTIKGVYDNFHDPDLAFVPLTPNKSTGDVLAWRKNTVLSPAIEKFLQFVNEQIQES